MEVSARIRITLSLYKPMSYLFTLPSKTDSILWRLDLVMDRIANWNDDFAHQRAIDNFVASLPSNQRKAPASTKVR
jgi:hypothetical protein